MATVWDALGINYEDIKSSQERAKKEFENGKQSIKRGAGVKPEALKNYDKYMKTRGYDPTRARKYYSDNLYSILNQDIDQVNYMINCTQDYLRTVFEIEIEEKDAATIAFIEFQKYYETNSAILNTVKELYPMIKSSVKNAHDFSDAELKTTESVMNKLRLEIPNEVKLIRYIRENYAKNQKKQALIDILLDLLPQINNKTILDQIATKALS